MHQNPCITSNHRPLACVSGADMSLLYDEQKDAGVDREGLSGVVAKYQFSLLSGEAVSSVIGGFLAYLSMRHAVWATVLAAWVPVAIALTIKERRSTDINAKSHLENFKEVIQVIFVRSRVVLFLVVNYLVWALSTFCAVWLLQKVWDQNGFSYIVFGLTWASFQIVAALTGLVTPRMEKRFGSRFVLIATALCAVIGYFALGLFEGTLALLAGIFFYFSRGMTMMIYKDAINWRIPSDLRATINSVLSLAFRGSFFVIGPIIGICVEEYGTNQTLVGMGVVFGALLVLLLPSIFYVTGSANPEVIRATQD